ncbi:MULTISPECIES: hypothetical protein [unclassified Mesorhizobium]|uniref:hypothetical protein n=1 Tax=unclassified Mesorhizobium TaxID=325217 RepID=UPI00112BEC82|nr:MULTISPECIES: hypothetical protein [unclassified Mesorhizobium]TPJ50636.1 hypothetical protein FJ426_24605 [Mesorhizobium sp. B2-6-4]TPM14010.1 hypothetical protein FJ953_26810 [Mesorhizobium sp. B2-3-6]
MTGPSDNLNDLEGDICNLSTLLETIFDVAVESEDAKVQQLLWIARDQAKRLTETAAACHHKLMSERKAAA